VLVEHAGRIVEKNELLEKVWPGVFIEEGNLSRHVFTLRQTLGDGPDGQSYIETVPRRGYRFIGTVQEEGAASLTVPALLPEEAQAAQDAARKPERRRALWLWPLALTALLVIAASLVSQRFWMASKSTSQKMMLAVLPFTNISSDPGNDYFADGFTEEMITQ